MRLCVFLFSALMLMAICAVGECAKATSAEYLSDIKHRFLYTYQGWGTTGIDVAAHAGEQEPMALQIKDKSYSKGIGTHASGEMVVELGGQYKTFEAEVGVQKQPSGFGSVDFKVYVDDRLAFDSGIMHETDEAKPVSVSVIDAQELRLVVGDGGDGITCDCANWANSRLIKNPSAKPNANRQGVDVAPFARVITSDPSRTDGCRAGRTQEFVAEDLFLDKDAVSDMNGNYKVAAYSAGLSSIGLRWIERRRFNQLSVRFADANNMPAVDSVKLEYWTGESNYQGRWIPLKGKIEKQGDSLNFSADLNDNSDLHLGTRKVRFIFPASNKPLAVRSFSVMARGACKTVDFYIFSESAKSGTGEVEVYNGAIADSTDSSLIRKWDTAQPLQFKVRCFMPKPWTADRTALRFRIPSGEFAVALDDVIHSGCVYAKEFGVFVTTDPNLTLAKYKKKIANQKTILQRVNEMPDQTLKQAMEKTHNSVQENGPIMLSLACDNSKFIVDRSGTVQFGLTTDSPNDGKYTLMLIPQFGSGKNENFERHLDGGWLPVPVMTIKDAGVSYIQKTFVAPFDKAPQANIWLNDKSLCVSEYTIENKQQQPADVNLRLAFLQNNTEHKALETQAVSSGAIINNDGKPVASVDLNGASSLKADIKDGAVLLTGTLPANSSAKCCVYMPRWEAKSEEYASFGNSADLAADTKAYWEKVMASAAQIEIPDPLLSNAIRASQVHCLIAARNEENGARISPWIAAYNYGPLESESNSIVRGMDMFGHSDFARNSLNFFIHRYNPQGYLTTGYTVMGTGWHLWMLGEHYGLTQDSQWMKGIAPEVARICNWITLQRDKTKRLDSRGRKVPEYGLMPPGVQADWNVYSYYFCLNGYFYAGLENASQALAAVNYPNADSLLHNASDFKSDILNAYSWAQAKMPVYPLKDGTSVKAYPSQVYVWGKTNDFFPAEDFNRSWCYDIELGAHQLVPQGVLDPNSKDVTSMMEHMEDVQFLSDGWFDYPASENQKDWYNLGGFSKVQPYYTHNAEIYAMRDDVKPFIRSYFNTISAMLNKETMWLWEHFHQSGAWNKTHETGYFLQQSRFMMVIERENELWLAPFVTNDWMKDGMKVSLANAPTRFGNVSYSITSHAKQGYIEATINPPTRNAPAEIVIRLRHPEGKKMRSVLVNGKPYKDFDPAKEIVRLRPSGERVTVRAEY